MKTLYTAEALASGEGRDGTAVTKDGKLSVALASPVELGGDGAGTNPEQLFAAGYAACFHSALRLVGRQAEGRPDGLRRRRQDPHRRPRRRSRLRPRRGTRDRPARRGPGNRRGPRGQGPPGLPVLQRHPRQHHCRHHHPGGRRMSAQHRNHHPSRHHPRDPAGVPPARPARAGELPPGRDGAARTPGRPGPGPQPLHVRRPLHARPDERRQVVLRAVRAGRARSTAAPSARSSPPGPPTRRRRHRRARPGLARVRRARRRRPPRRPAPIWPPRPRTSACWA